ncbi:MAG: NADH-quinone oxidoreductase subunit J [Chloroflexi bacterium]|nr:NADH-quinone oxidoreductase subunit J [Chloroflexota bacterium]
MTDSVMTVSFYILSAILLGSALAVVFFRSLIYSAFSLALSFLSVAGLYILLRADFIAAVQIVIYVGAVMVLVLFAVMLTEQVHSPRSNPFSSQSIAAALMILILLGIMVVAIARTPWVVSPEVTVGPTAALLGRLLFTDFALPFEIASIVLLVAMIGAIIIARED